MRILQLTNKIPYPPKDGGAIATLNISKGLTRLGHEVTLLGMNTSKHYFDLNGIPAHISEKIQFLDVKIDTDIHMMAGMRNLLFSAYPYNFQRFFREEFAEKLKEVLLSSNYDVVQLEGLYMGYYIPVIRQYCNALVALRAHNIEHEIWERTAIHEKSFWKKMYLRILARRIKKYKMTVLNRYDLLIPITQRDANQYEVLGNKKPAFVVPAGFDTSKIKPQPEKVKFPSLFFIGTLDWFPNQEGLVWFTDKVWPLLHKDYPDLKFNVAGRNAPQWIIDLFRKTENIHYHGEIDNAYAFINENAVMIAPLFSGSGMRVKIIEGMALGKTIVTTSVGAEGIDVKHDENIIIENEPESFANSVKELINHKQKFEKIGRNAIDFVDNHYNNDKISASLADFYQEHL